MTQPRALLTRLSGLMFLHFFSLAAPMPLLTLWLTSERGLDGGGAGWVWALGSLAAALAPLAVAPVADRRVRGETLLVWLNLGAAASMAVLSQVGGFWALGLGFAAFMGFKAPTFGLVNSVSMAHLGLRPQLFPRVRMWGTLGWIAGGLFYSWVWRLWFADLTGALLLSAAACAAQALYALTLPGRALAGGAPSEVENAKPAAPPGSAGSGAGAVPGRSWSWLSPTLAALLSAAFLMTLADRFYFFGSAYHLRGLGIGEAQLLPLLSLGQATEVAGLFLLAWLLKRLGFRRAFLWGIGLQALRFALWAWWPELGPLTLAILLHGLIFTLFHSSTVMAIDRITPLGHKARVHQVYIFVLEGLGVVAGNLLAGQMGVWFPAAAGGGPDFAWFWSLAFAASLAAGAVILFTTTPKTLPSGPDAPGLPAIGGPDKPD